MAEIQEYTPQVSASEPVGGVSPNIELAGAVGRSMRGLGQSLEQAGQLFHRKAAAEETADVYADSADRRARFMAKIQQGIQDGSLDVDKVMEEYDNEESGVGSNLSTPEGRNYFERQQSRNRGFLQKMAISGQLQVTSRKAQDTWQQGLNADTTSLYSSQDPSHAFEDYYNRSLESIDQLIKSGGLPEKLRDHAVMMTGRELAKAAISGEAAKNPAIAKHMLDAGAYDQFIDADLKKQLYGEIKTQQYAKTVEAERIQKAQKLAQEAKFNKWFNDVSDKLENHNLSVDDITQAFHKGDIDAFQRHDMIKMVETMNKRDSVSPSANELDAFRRIADPSLPEDQKISHPYEAMLLVGQGKISHKYYSEVLKPLLEAQQDPMLQASGQSLMDLYKKSQTLLYQNPMTGLMDGHDRASDFLSDSVRTLANPKASGANPADLLNPSSPSWLGNKLFMYQSSPQEQFQSMADERVKRALNFVESRENPENKAPPPQALKADEINDPERFLQRVGGLPKGNPPNFARLPSPKDRVDSNNPPGLPPVKNPLGPGSHDDISYAVDQIGQLMDFINTWAKDSMTVPEHESFVSWFKRMRKKVPSDQ